MKVRSASILLVGIFLVTVAITGCTSTSNNGTSPSASPASSATPLPAIGSTLTVNSMLDLTHVNWYEYQIVPSGTVVDLGRGFTTEGSNMTERWDFNADYNGQKADKVTGTGNYPNIGETGSTIVYMDHADHKQILGGNLTLTKNGKAIYQGDIGTKLLELLSLSDLTNSSYSGPHTVTYGGIETVAVPFGTYSTTKYGYNEAMNLTVYMNSNVPVPIKVNAVSASGTIYEIELMGWG